MRRPTTPLLSGLALVLLLLGGCATQGTAPEATRSADDWQAQKTRVEAMQTWELTGKAGLRTPEDSTSANLDWNQTPYHFRMLLSGPFGSGRSVLEGREGRVSLTTGEGRFEAESPEALMNQRLGWSLPVAALGDWVRGLPADDSPHRMSRDARGFPARLEQDGWIIDYQGWMRVQDLWLPRRMKMRYGDLNVTLVVTRWQPETTDA